MAYGLGQENLLLEQAKADLREAGVEPETAPEIQEWEQWLDGERYTFLTEVNVGNWGPNLRKRAEEAGLLNLHRNDYARWSSATHNMWHHVVRFNLEACRNPLHGYHRLPAMPELEPRTTLLQQAAEYVDLSLSLFDEATETKVDTLTAVEVLDREMQKLADSSGSEGGD